MREDRLCSVDMPVSLSLGGEVVAVALEMPAKDWADRLGIAWDTVRQRRYRGDSWSEALQPCLRRTTFNSPSAFVPAPQRKKLTVNGALQMAELKIKIPAVAHVIVTGVSGGVQAAVMRRIQEVLQEDFGATATAALPDPAEAEAADDVKKALWVVSSA
ncbi:hypothetical protein [Aquipseudomonas campi]